MTKRKRLPGRETFTFHDYAKGYDNNHTVFMSRLYPSLWGVWVGMDTDLEHESSENQADAYFKTRELACAYAREMTKG